MDVLQGRRRDVGARRRGRVFTVGLIVAAVALAVIPASALAALETTIDSGPQGQTNDSTPTFTFSSPDPNATSFECAVDSDSFGPCTGAHEHTAGLLADGIHTFTVRALDSTGTPGPQERRTFRVDTIPPETVIDSGPSSATNDTAPAFAFSSPNSPNATFNCQLDGQGFTSCASPFTPGAPLSEGTHTFEVSATDPATNVDATPASVTFTVDVTPPDTTIDSGPSGTNNAPTFTFSSPGDANTTFACRVDGVSFVSCTSPFTTEPLGHGQHTFEVLATDAAGNVDPSAAAVGFTVDTASPDTTIDSGPPDTTSDNTLEFFFSSDDPGATFECRLDGDDFAPCSSPFASPALSDGPHAFEVRARDGAGNVDLSPARIAFMVSTSSASSTSGPGPSVSTSVAPARAATSFVLIAKRTIRVSRRRFAPVTLNCAGSKDCAGTVTLTTARRVRLSQATARAEDARKRSRRRHRRARRVRLGSTSFEIPARVTARVRVRLSRSRYRLVRRLGRVRVLVTVTDKDGSGRPRIGTREIILRTR
jgi:hypothetical protein